MALSAALVAAEPAAALFQVNAFSGPRVWDEVASIPLGIAPVTKTVKFRADGKTYRGIWANYSFRYPTTTYALKLAYRDRRSDAENGVFVDRPLTRTERGRFVEVADLYREADVLVLAGANPACSGLTRAQAHGIATGRYTRWSQVGAGSGDIHVRYLLDEAGGPEPRLGTLKPSGKVSYAPSARAAPDGGVSLAASGDASIAAVTTWSLARRGVGSACVVPIGGVAPSDETVRNLRYPEAFAVRYVLLRRPPRTGYARHLRSEFGKYLRSARLKKKLLAKGLLVTGEPAPVSGPQAPSARTTR